VTVEYPSAAGPVVALDDVTVQFPERTSTAIVGRSGSGKSTMVSVLGLLRRPTAGEVSIGEIDASRLATGEMARLRSTCIGIVFQAFHLETSLSSAENVMLPWYFRSREQPRVGARRRAAELLDLLGIGDLAERRPNEMSGGQRQRVAIARALFSEPTLFMADEPTGNLDEETANGVAETILGLPSVLGTTVVVVTHDTVVATKAGRTMQLIRGRVQEDTGSA
jgi:ABC-type lipoprotein export system ATPase subunit